MFWVLVYIGGLFIWPVWNNKSEAVPVYYSLSRQKFEALTKVRQRMDLTNPDYELLDAAIFHASNKVREQEGKKKLNYSSLLYQSASFHANAMIQLDFYDHYNLKQLKYLTPDKRIAVFGGYFNYTAENIAEFGLINTGPEYCPVKKGKNEFRYTNCKTGESYLPYTYLAFAEVVVNGWLNSPPHRKSLLSNNFQYLGCAARYSKKPFGQKQMPFARLVQNFGGYGPENEKVISKP